MRVHPRRACRIHPTRRVAAMQRSVNEDHGLRVSGKNHPRTLIHPAFLAIVIKVIDLAALIHLEVPDIVLECS